MLNLATCGAGSGEGGCWICGACSGICCNEGSVCTCTGTCWSVTALTDIM